MKRLLGTTVALAVTAIFISSAQAINIDEATIQNGQVFIAGNQAPRRAAISWEGTALGINSNPGGAFHFNTTNLPPDCVGRLQIGTEAIDVVINNCTPASIAIIEAGVPQTGQTTSYAAGDDGALQKGVELPTLRFTDKGNGTIKDNLTRLIWLKNANCIGTSYPGFDQVGILGDGAVLWQHALDFVAGINAGTYDCGDTSNAGTHQTDWRLPNIRELFSLVDFAFFSPAISNAAGTGKGSGSDPFSNFPPSPFSYLSSTSMARVPGGMFYFDFEDGILREGNKGGPHLGFVTAVRGGS